MSDRFLNGLSKEIAEWLERTGLVRAEDRHNTGDITIEIPVDGCVTVTIVRLATDKMMREKAPDLSGAAITFDDLTRDTKKEIEARLLEWRGTLTSALLQDGEVYAKMVPNPKLQGPFKCDLKLIDPGDM